MKFTTKEIEAMEKEIDGLSDCGEQIKKSAHKIFSKMEESGLDPKQRLAEMASQEKWDGEKYGGDCFFVPGYNGPFAGGLQESVFSNMFHDFGLYAKYAVSGYLIPCILVARVMAEDEKTNLYVRSILAGSKRVNDVKGQWDARSKLIYRVITSIMNP